MSGILQFGTQGTEAHKPLSRTDRAIMQAKYNVARQRFLRTSAGRREKWQSILPRYTFWVNTHFQRRDTSHVVVTSFVVREAYVMPQPTGRKREE